MLLATAPALANPPNARPVDERPTPEKLEMARHILRDWNTATIVLLGAGERVPMTSTRSRVLYAAAARKALADNRRNIDLVYKQDAQLLARYETRAELLTELKYQESPEGRSIRQKALTAATDCLTGHCGYYPTTPEENTARDKSNLLTTPSYDARFMTFLKLSGNANATLMKAIWNTTVENYCMAGGEDCAKLRSPPPPQNPLIMR